MKKLTIIAFIATFLMLGCEKDRSNYQTDTTVNDPKEAFESRVAAGASISKKNTIASEDFKIIWEKKIQISDSTFIFPIEISNPFYMRLDGKNSILMNKRVHLMASKNGKWNFVINSLLPNRHSVPNAFSGVLVSSDYFDGTASYANYFKGFPLSKNQDMEGNRKFTLLSGSAGGCNTVHAYVNGVYRSSTTYCNYSSGVGGGSTGEPGEWQVPLPEDADNHGGGYTVQDITNNIQQECLKSMVDNLINKDITFNANESLQSIFGVNGIYDLVFNESTTLSSTVHGTAATVDGHWVDGKVEGLKVEINLNLTTLANASQEYIAMVILHESTHAYLYAQGFVESQTQMHHEQMWLNYVDFIANYLTNNYGTPGADAYAMATVGLQKTFGSRISETIYNKITNYKGDVSEDRMREAEKYRSGEKGTSCTSN